jgi:hypothetical protein
LLLSTFFDLFSPVLFLFTRPTSLARLNSKTRWLLDTHCLNCKKVSLLVFKF